jgi:hypothetical protein
MTELLGIVTCNLIEVDRRFAVTVVAVHISETSVYFNETTQHYITYSCHVPTYLGESLKSHVVSSCTPEGNVVCSVGQKV